MNSERNDNGGIPASPTARPVILDCDPGVDDAMAIFYGLRAPEVDLVAIGTVWGNVGVEVTTQNALRLLEIAGRPTVPVAMGAAKPLLGPVPHFAGAVHGQDGQGNLFLPPPDLQPTGESAPQQIVRLAHERPGELTLVAVGPLTNVALAVLLDPRIAGAIKEVVLMGGAFLIPGNVTPVAEANIWHDPEAAQIVVEAGWPVTIVGLDVTEGVRLTQGMLDELGASGTPAGAHLHRATGVYLSAYEARYGRRECPLHDALALGIAVDRSLVVRAPTVRVDIERAGTYTRGMTVGDLRPPVPSAGANTTVVLETDGPRFRRHWLDLMSTWA